MISSPRYTAFLDACVLYPAVVRDVLLSFAAESMYKVAWSAEVHDEWTRNLLLNRPDLTAITLKTNTRQTITAKRCCSDRILGC